MRDPYSGCYLIDPKQVLGVQSPPTLRSLPVAGWRTLLYPQDGSDNWLGTAVKRALWPSSERAVPRPSFQSEGSEMQSPWRTVRSCPSCCKHSTFATSSSWLGGGPHAPTRTPGNPESPRAQTDTCDEGLSRFSPRLPFQLAQARRWTPMQRIALPIYQIDDRPVPRPRRPKHSANRAEEAYFAVLTFVILGMIIGLAAYTILTLIPAWQRSLSSPGHLQHLYLGPNRSQIR